MVLTWSKNCALADMTVRAAENNNDPPAIVAPTGFGFQTRDTKLDVPVVTLPKENFKNIFEQLKSEFKRTVKWDKYRSQMTVQGDNNNLNFLIDPNFTRVNRLFVLSFEVIEENNVKKDYRDDGLHYYVPNVEIKDFNVLMDGKCFFDFPVKSEEEAYQKIIEMSRNNDYTTSNLLNILKKITD